MTSPLSTAAESILDIAADGLVDAGIEVPVRSYVTFGLPDLTCVPCDTLAVHVDRTAPTTAFPRESSAEVVKCAVRTAVTFVVTVSACWPIATDTRGTAAAPSVLQAAAEGLYDRWWAIWRALMQAAVDRTLAAGQRTSLGAGGSGAANGPQGGCAWATIRVTVELVDEVPGS